MATTCSAIAAAVRRYYRRNPALYAKMSRLLEEIHREFGWTSRLSAALGGPYVLWRIRQEERRLAAGWTYEPPTFYEVNDAVRPGDRPAASPCRYVVPQAGSPDGSRDTLPQLPQPRSAARAQPRHVGQSRASAIDEAQP